MVDIKLHAVVNIACMQFKLSNELSLEIRKKLKPFNNISTVRL